MKKLAVVVISILVATVLIACGGVPNFVSNPPETADEMRTKLTDNQWEIVIDDVSVYAGTTLVAMKTNPNSLEGLPADRIVDVYVVYAVYAISETYAIQMHELLKEILSSDSLEMPAGTDVEIKDFINGSIVTFWMSASLTVAEVGLMFL